MEFKAIVIGGPLHRQIRKSSSPVFYYDIFILVVAAVFGVGAISFNAGQHSPDTKNIFTSIEEKNGL